MKLVFFDESKNDPDYPHYHLAAVGIDDSTLLAVEAELHKLALEAFGDAELSRATEFHAAEIYHRKRSFADWHLDRRLALIVRFAEILSREDVALIDIQINCDLLRAEQSAEELAFMFLCERSNDWVRGQKSIGMLIGDRESDSHADRYATSLSGYRARGTDLAFGREINHLVDSAHFTHSHLSRFLQLADVHVWLRQFINRNGSSANERHRAVFAVLKRDSVDLFPTKYKEWPKRAGP